jgi:subtilisin-like proprotein convertase family protein
MCGGALTASLHLQDGPRDLGTLNYTFTLGALGNAVLAGAYSSGNIVVPIPDQNTVDVPIDVPHTGAIADIKVRLRLNHTFDGDLQISLVHPDGTIVALSNRRGGVGDNFGSGPNDCSGTFAVFDDAAAAPIVAGVAPFAGSFKPEQPLAALNGKETSGVWTLRVSDRAPFDVGTVGCVQLEINRRRSLCCPFAGAPVVQAAPPAVVTAESCSIGGGNGAADPDETVTVEFPLQNVGDGLTSNVVATLLAGGGVHAPSGPQSYGALSPIGPPVSRPFTFVASGTCGGTIVAALHLQDGTVDLGTATFNLAVGGTEPAMTPVSDPARMTIPAAGTGSGTGAPAAPYPSTIEVSGVAGTVTSVAVTLATFSHAFPDDVDVLLVGPGGQKLILMSDAGGSPDVLNVTLTFDDNATRSLPDSTLIASGVYRPTNYGAIDTFPAPAPAPPYLPPAPAGGATLASTFNGIDPNGAWSLYVVDDADGDVGAIADGWSLTITTAAPLCCEQACTLTCPADIVASNDAQLCLAGVGYPAPIVDGSCGVVVTALPSGSAFPVGSTPVTGTATRLSDGGTTTCRFEVTVNDVELPAIAGESVSVPTLWPPNHEMVDVTVSYSTSDNCGPVTTSLSVTSNEPINGMGDGDTDPDWEIVDDHHVRLRAERAGGGTGRIYTITITATDAHGTSSQRTVTVVVPHDQ